MSRPQGVTFDVHVLVSAVVEGNSSFWTWPTPPPLGPYPASECLGIVNDAEEFALWLSEHVLRNTIRVLTSPEGYRWQTESAEEYARVLSEIAQISDGGICEPAVSVADCIDYEDNRILELALASGSALIVSADRQLQEMSPWRGIPIIGASAFVARVDAMRRTSRRS